MSAEIKGASNRDLYEMTYRLVNKPAKVMTTKGVWTGRLGSGTWDRKADDGTLSMLQVNGEAGGREFPFSTIMRIELIQS